MLHPYKNQIRAADAQDWQTFQSLAEEEGWRVPHQELALHRQGGCSRAWVLRDHDATIGLVTGVLHQHSAWIGNLIIAPAQRGRGCGAVLFDHAAKEMRAAGATTLWLTASEQGAPLYAKRGFYSVGTIERWVRRSGGSGDGVLPSPRVDGKAIDRAVWGDDRTLLLCHQEKNGIWLQQGESLSLLQRGDDLQIIGPWYGSPRLRDDAELLARLVAGAAPRVELVVDLLGDCGRKDFLLSAGFTCSGNTKLMAADPPQVQWSRLLALASLGSCG